MKKNKLPSPITILILTLITAVVWVSFNIYRALTTAPAPIVPQTISQPLTPTLDQNAINKIESATFLNDSQIPAIGTGPSGTGTPAPIVLPSPTALPVVTPTASPSASP